MSDPKSVGHIAWQDLTVGNADEIRKFYCEVVGWKSEPHSMGEYDDFVMNAPDSGHAISGICHARGSNAGLPPQWLIYITVDHLDDSAERCVELGGKVIDGPRKMGENRYCVIEDPAGAVAALIGS